MISRVLLMYKNFGGGEFKILEKNKKENWNWGLLINMTIISDGDC